MAQKVQKYEPFYRGDTPVFAFLFTQPYAGYNWSAVTADIAMTSVSNPTDNTGAAVLRTNVVLSIDAYNSAKATMQPTVAESKALIPGTDYIVQIQLKEGTTNVATPATAQVKVLQDFVI